MDAARKRARTLIKSLGVVGMAAVAAPPQSPAPLTIEGMRAWRSLDDHPLIAAVLSRRKSLQTQLDSTHTERQLAAAQRATMADARAHRMAATGQEEPETAQEQRLGETLGHLATRAATLETALSHVAPDLETARVQARREVERVRDTARVDAAAALLAALEPFQLRNSWMQDLEHTCSRLLKDGTDGRFLYLPPALLRQLGERWAKVLPRLTRALEG